MKILRTLALVLVTLAVAMPAAAQPARLYDKDVKQLLDQSKQTYERFWDALDSQLKGTTFKSASGEFVVKKIGEDYKKAIDLARERFTDNYSSSTEVGAFLKDAVRIQNYVSQQGAGMKGAPEWQAHANTLGQLAHEYGGTFPPAENQAWRRYADTEVIQAAASIEQASKQVATLADGTLKKDKATPDATRKAILADVKALGDQAKALGSALKGNKPASAQVTTLLGQASKVKTALAGSSAASVVQGPLSGVDSKLAIIATTFHQK